MIASVPKGHAGSELGVSCTRTCYSRRCMEPSLHLALVAPLIPQNTGNVGRLALAFGLRLHLVGPLGFSLDEKACRRAGLDYWEFVDLRVHKSWNEFLSTVRPAKLWYFSKRAIKSYAAVEYREDDFLVFGRETRGLPQDLLDANPDRALRIPMMGTGVRSLNLSNAVSIVLYEALRQLEKT